MTTTYSSYPTVRGNGDGRSFRRHTARRDSRWGRPDTATFSTLLINGDGTVTTLTPGRPRNKGARTGRPTTDNVSTKCDETGREPRRLERKARREERERQAFDLGYTAGLQGALRAASASPGAQGRSSQDGSNTVTRTDNSNQTWYSSFVPSRSTVKSAAGWAVGIGAFTAATVGSQRYGQANDLTYLRGSAIDDAVFGACSTAGSYVADTARSAASGVSGFFGGGTVKRLTDAASSVGGGLISRMSSAAGSV